MRRTAVLGTLLALFALSGCKEDGLPAGTAGRVIVQAFVDVDGSGAFSTGDVAITGSVTLTPAGGTGTQMTLDATGQAIFTDVMPGSYQATFTGTAPTGAVLATAPLATVVVPFKGGDVAAQFRYVDNPGTIDGVVFRDDNANGVFDAATDTPGPGLTVNLFSAPPPALPVATTTTSATGAFHFSAIRPGKYVVEIGNAPPTAVLVGGDTSSVVVTAAAASQVARRFTGNLLIPIAQARTAAVGSTVAFQGVALANAGLVGTNQLYVEDPTTGILVFGAPTAGIVAGDNVLVVGVTSVFNGELEVVAPSGGTLSVTKVSSGTAPGAKVITVSQLLSSGFLSQLVSVQGARVRSVVTTSATAYNVNFVGNTPADTFQVRIGNTNNIPIPSTFWEVGRAYDVTGLDGFFGTSQTVGEHQLKPRSSADVVVGALTLTIAQARTHPANDTVSVVGVVYAGTGVYTQPTAANLTIYIQDASGGTEVFGIPSGTVYVPGDSVSVRGVVAFFSGEYEISKFASGPPTINKLGTGAIVQPKSVTTADFAAKIYDGQFIRVNGLQVVSVSTPSAAGAYNVVTTALDGTAITIRIDQSTVGILNTSWVVGTKYDVVGAALNFVSGATTTPEIKPRSPADVSLSNVNVITIANARTNHVNDTVTVEGIVTAGRGTFRVDNAYIQDATGGVQIFNLPLSLALAVGDAVRVHGKMAIFSNENEITNNITPTDSIKVTKLGPGGALAPKVLTGAQFLTRTFEGQLVTLQSVTVNTITTPGGTGTYTVTGTALDGSAITVFMSAPTGAVPPPASLFVVGSKYDLTGIAVPFGTPVGAELKPRGAADVVPR